MADAQDILSSRLSTVASLIPASDLVIDVGSDHGKLGAWCLSNEICPRLIATDIHEAPAKRTESFLRLGGFSEVSQAVCTDGLTGIEIVDRTTVVIAGMGGLEIRKILSDYLETHEKFPLDTTLVLQPQRSFYELRTFLQENSIEIEKEAIVLDRGHYYVVIRAKMSEKVHKLTDAELFLGPYILSAKPERFEEYMEHQRKLMEKQALGDSRCKAVVENWEALL